MDIRIFAFSVEPVFHRTYGNTIPIHGTALESFLRFHLNKKYGISKIKVSVKGYLIDGFVKLEQYHRQAWTGTGRVRP
jgi:hypothetical protein